MIGSKLKVGPCVYSINMATGTLANEGRELWGKTQLAKHWVAISSEAHEEQQRETVWHEAYHVHLYQTGQTSVLPDDSREGFIDMIAFGALYFLKENPWMCPNECCQREIE